MSDLSVQPADSLGFSKIKISGQWAPYFTDSPKKAAASKFIYISNLTAPCLKFCIVPVSFSGENYPILN